jgi:hemerythrin-like metal-binding protein
MMARYRYPRLAEHKAEHDLLTKKVQRIHQDLVDGRAIPTIDVMKFLEDWLYKHIEHSDMQYTEYINARAA